MRYLLMICFMSLALFSCKKNSIDSRVDELFKEFTKNTPGAAVAVFKNSEIVLSKGYGLANVKTKSKINSETNFRLASITKQFTSASILLLIQDQKLNLDTRLIDIIPEFPEYGNLITIKQLLQHTSGLLNYEEHIHDSVNLQLMDEDVLKILIEQDSLYFQPGTQHKYSNSGYALLSLVVEKISGQKFPDFLTERIFKPLRMINSLAYIKGYNEIPNRSFGYAKENGEYIFSDQSLTSAVLGDGGIYTSITDMSLWDEALNNTTLLSQAVLDECWTKGVTISGVNFDYGFGWRLSEYNGYRLHYHTGSTNGYSNIYMRFPEENLSVLVLINIRDYPAFELGKEVADIFLPFN